MKVAETPNGKEIHLIRDRSGVFKFQFGSGGELPLELSGIFMDERNANVALNRYLDKIKSKQNVKG